MDDFLNQFGGLYMNNWRPTFQDLNSFNSFEANKYFFAKPEKKEYDFNDINLFVAGCVAIALSLLISLLFTVHKKGRNDTPIHASETKINKKIIDRIKTNVGEYNPPWWYSPDLGTLVAFGHDPKLPYETEIVERTEDNLPVSYSIDWWPCKPPQLRNNSSSSSSSSSSSASVEGNEASPSPSTSSTSHPNDQSGDGLRIIVFVPGLGLTARNKFCQKFCQYVHSQGQFTIAVISARGLDVPLKSKSLWHPALDGDAKHAVLSIHATYPQASIFTVGYSAGSNIVQRLVSNPSLQPIIKGAMIVCYNKDYLTGRQHLEGHIKGLGYSMAMTQLQKQILQLNIHIHSELGHSFVRKLFGCRFLSEYDSVAHAAYGYESLTTYYAALSGVPSNKICVPCLIIQPLDDPLHSGKVAEHIDIPDLISNPLVVYVQPQYGNHFGFYEGPLLSAFSNTTSYTYPAKLAKEYFDALCDQDIKGL